MLIIKSVSFSYLGVSETGISLSRSGGGVGGGGYAGPSVPRWKSEDNFKCRAFASVLFEKEGLCCFSLQTAHYTACQLPTSILSPPHLPTKASGLQTLMLSIQSSPTFWGLDLGASCLHGLYSSPARTIFLFRDACHERCQAYPLSEINCICVHKLPERKMIL